MYDLLLINPDTEIGKKYSKSSGALSPPMGTFSIASFILAKGYKVKLVDTRIVNHSDKVIYDLAKESRIIGLSVMTAQIEHSLILCKKIKELYPDKIIVWGGVHPSLFPEQTAEHPLIDYIIVGEGEKAMLDIVEGKKFNSNIIQGDMLTIDEIPTNDYSLIDDVERYIDSNFNGKMHRKLEYSTSRGCMFRCAFCVNVVLWKRNYRLLPADRVLDEVEYLVKKYNLSSIWFRDEDMFGNKKRTQAILEGIIKRKLKIEFRTNLRVSYFNGRYIDDDFLSLMYRAGARELYHGVESGSDRVRKIIKKDITERQVLRSAVLYKKHKIVPVYSFMCAVPGETKEEFYETLNLMDKIKKICPEAIILGPQPYRPYPGGELYDLAIEQGYIPPKSLEDWVKETDLFTSSVKPDKFPWVRKDMVKLYENAGKYVTLGTRKFSQVWKLSKMMIIPWAVSRLRWKLKFFYFPIDWYLYKFATKFIAFY